MKKSMFFYAHCLTRVLNNELVPVEVCIGDQPHKDLREYDYFATYSHRIIKKEWLIKIKNKPTLIIGSGKPKYYSSPLMGLDPSYRKKNGKYGMEDGTDAFDDEWSGVSESEVEFERLDPPATTVETKVALLRALYGAGYLYSFKKMPQGTDILCSDVGKNALVWRKNNFVWAGLPKQLVRTFSYTDNSDEIDASAVIIGILAELFFGITEELTPEWEKETYFSWELKILKENEDLRKKIFENEAKVQMTMQIRSALWKRGTPLEDALKVLFNDIGIKIFKKYDLDFVIEYGKKHILVEVKGMEKNLGKESRPEIETQINTHTKEWKTKEKEAPKLVLIINQECKYPPKQRNPLNAKHLQILTDETECCVISVIELLKIYEAIKEGKLGSKALCDAFLTHTGELKANQILST